MRRRQLVREIARFTTTDGLHHLLSFGELSRCTCCRGAPGSGATDRRGRRSSSATKIADNHLQDWESKYRLGREVAGREAAGASSTRPERAEGVPGRRPPGRASARQRRHLHGLRRPRDDRRLVPLAGLAQPRAHGAVRPRRHAQRLLGVRDLPGLGQRPRRRSRTPGRRRSQRTRSCSTRSRRSPPTGSVSAANRRQARRAARPDAAGDRPAGHVPLQRPRAAAHGARARHPLAPAVQGQARAAAAARQRRWTPSCPPAR